MNFLLLRFVLSSLLEEVQNDPETVFEVSLEPHLNLACEWFWRAYYNVDTFVGNVLFGFSSLSLALVPCQRYAQSQIVMHKMMIITALKTIAAQNRALQPPHPLRKMANTVIAVTVKSLAIQL